MSRHRVELKFDDGVYATLICPDDGSCKGADVCPRCGADLHDGQAQRCYDCFDMDPGECWVKTWFDNCTADELLRGSLTVEIDAEWTGDEMVARLVAPDAGRDWTGECERCGGTGVLPGGDDCLACPAQDGTVCETCARVTVEPVVEPNEGFAFCGQCGWQHEDVEGAWQEMPATPPDGWQPDPWDEDAPCWEFCRSGDEGAVAVWVCGPRGTRPPHKPRPVFQGHHEPE